MQQKRFWFTMSGILAVLAVAFMLPTGAVAASKYKVIYRFTGGADGGYPQAGVIFDKAGNLYGTTPFGGVHDAGVVFELKRNSDGSWTESVLYSFCSLDNCADGAPHAPGRRTSNAVKQGNGYSGFESAGPIFDKAGNLYGTTTGGGAFHGGVVFKLTPNSDGSWTESVLHSFCSLDNCADGSGPTAGVIFDEAGNLYGTTTGDLSGSRNGGTVFKLTPNSDGSWTESVLYTFSASGDGDGDEPNSALIFDGARNLYGTTLGGGIGCPRFGGCGEVFRLTPNSDGSWTESVLHSFTTRRNGNNPEAALIFDVAGNLYSTTIDGGDSRDCTDGCGTVFKLTPNSDGSWTESVLHRFANNPAADPYAGLTFDPAGNLYGTTLDGGAVHGGAVFKLAPNADEGWAYSVLHVFLGKPALTPFGGVVLDKVGNLYGTTGQCSGTGCKGVVYEITP